MYRERKEEMLNKSEKLLQYDGKRVRITTDSGEIFEGIADVCFDEDDSDEYVLYLPHNRWKNCLEKIHENDISKIEILTN